MRFRSPLRWRRDCGTYGDADIGARPPQKAKELMEEDDEETSSVAESAEQTDAASIDEDSIMEDEDGSHVNGIGIAH